MQMAAGHALNRQTSEGHVAQSDADNMYAYCKLLTERKCTQVRVSLSFSSIVFFIGLITWRHVMFVYTCATFPQGEALAIMGGTTGASKASMWKQVFDVVHDNWAAFQMDQERKTPLVSRTFYSKQSAKRLRRDLMNKFLGMVVLSCVSQFVRSFVTACLPFLFLLGRP